MERHQRLGRRILAAFFFVALALALAAADVAPVRVVAVADVHGAYAGLTALLQRARLVDANLRWAGGAATLVQTGDLLDRGAGARQCLDLVMSLEGQAPRRRGRVIPLLGNHEVMNVMGDVRYATPQIYATFAGGGSEKKRTGAYADYLAFLAAHAGHAHAAGAPADEAARTAWMDQHPAGYFEYRDAMGPRGKYGRWIRLHHAVAQVGDGVFVHGGLNPALSFANAAELDARVSAELAAFDAIWKTLVDAKVAWRYMTLAEAVRFVTEELTWLQAGGATAKPDVDRAMRQLIGYKTWMAASPDGPLWYRGLAEQPEEPLLEGLTTMLTRLQARYVVVGHSVVSKTDVTTRFGGRVFLIDTGMLKESYGGRPSALEIRGGAFTALYADGEPKVLAPPPARAEAPR